MQLYVDFIWCSRFKIYLLFLSSKCKDEEWKKDNNIIILFSNQQIVLVYRIIETPMIQYHLKQTALHRHGQGHFQKMVQYFENGDSDKLSKYSHISLWPLSVLELSLHYWPNKKPSVTSITKNWAMVPRPVKEVEQSPPQRRLHYWTFLLSELKWYQLPFFLDKVSSG